MNKILTFKKIYINMTSLEIPAKNASPYVKFDPAGRLEIKGRSFDEDVISLYNILIQKIQDFGNSGKDYLEVSIYLKYFNTASSKCLFNLVTALKEINEEKGVEVNMTWNFIEGDDAMEEEIEEMREDTEFDFKILPEKDFL